MNSGLIISPVRMDRYFLMKEKLVINPYVTLASVTSGCILTAMEYFQSIILDAVLKIKMEDFFLFTIRAMVREIINEKTFLFFEIFKNFKDATASIVGGGDAEDMIDVKNINGIKFVQHGGKGKKVGKKDGKSDGKKESHNSKNEEAAKKRQKEEEERVKKWNDDWYKKLKAKEILDDVPCCSADGLFLKPKTQSNIWIKVTKDKNVQDVQMAFMHVPVPKPKPPPLPKIVKIIEPEEESISKSKKSTKKKKGGKKK